MCSTTIEASQTSQKSLILHRTEGGYSKQLHPAPALDKVDQTFNTPFEEAKHSNKLRRELKTDHLLPDLQTALTELVKKY